MNGADGDRQFATFTPTPPLTPGRHVLTVAAVMVNGQVLTRSIVYTVSADAPQAVLRCGLVGFTVLATALLGSLAQAHAPVSRRA